ncbi:hypothetical protein ASD11_01300 [Aeromicrobium sp. Root495]|uniref:sigma factor-like helix-turn-helix DNA-binding protein n=1 Tax=Aeromicrobium sp. Root495 TaxID=1736550 RepID=UPI0006FEE3DE|nr:sigma factor-like helix-turn-helix DNA-binding protein [Aeromicrobium sp. Root495]KQY58331.1 hypothetical protein ASD11_01300 [Aeromicrobium sp. Root495]
MRRGTGVTVKEIAAFLNLSEGRVRVIINEHGIESTGSEWKAKLYDLRSVLRVTGARDRAARLN